ncbi:MAG: asparagine synthase (glutamine-hydrolyzing) [Pseudomonadota bacterium]
MCGICGIVDIGDRPVPIEHIRLMNDALVHRGPDGRGEVVEYNMGIGHCRLSIIDLSDAASQPMACNAGMYCISYNGEIYNYRELRRELENLGYAFLSRSDTEVVLNAFIAWGEHCVSRFNGMFAFAVWDRNHRRMFLARDRYGIKPLYHMQVGNKFMFASEHKAFLVLPFVDRCIDKEALIEYFTFQNIFTHRTLIKNVHLFPPGHYAYVSSDEGGMKLARYWDYDFYEPEQQRSEADYLEELDFLFKRAVKRQMVSDVGCSTYLSGGMDSGAITAIASKEIPYIRTFTCGFDLHSASGMELAFDEREKSEYMSYVFKTEHYEMVLKAGDMERVLPRLVWHLEEPRVGQSYPNYYAAQLASKFGKVVLAGTGGDELFGGYPWRYYRNVVNEGFEDYISKYYSFWQRLLPDHAVRLAFSPIWDEVCHVQPREIFKNVFQEHADRLTRPEDYVNHSLYFEAKTFLHGLLMVEDKLSMAHGLETRVPFLDNDLVDFAMRVPVRYKLGNLDQIVRMNENEPGLKVSKYYQKNRDGKLLLRKAMSRHIPDTIATAVKQGFSAPDASWFKGESIDYVRSVLYGDARIFSYLDKTTIQRLVDEHLSGQVNRRLLIWSLLSFEQWCKTYLP